MSQVIRISEDLVTRFQSLARPLVDDWNSVLERACTALEEKQTCRADDSPPRCFNGNDIPDVIHTKIVNASVGGAIASNWNDLVFHAIRIALESGRSVDKTRSISRLNLVAGNRTDTNFTPINGCNASFQLVDANRALRAAAAVAQDMHLDLNVEFRWRDKEGASFPGELGNYRLK